MDFPRMRVVLTGRVLSAADLLALAVERGPPRRFSPPPRRLVPAAMVAARRGALPRRGALRHAACVRESAPVLPCGGPATRQWSRPRRSLGWHAVAWGRLIRWAVAGGCRHGSSVDRQAFLLAGDTLTAAIRRMRARFEVHLQKGASAAVARAWRVWKERLPDYTPPGKYSRLALGVAAPHVASLELRDSWLRPRRTPGVGTGRCEEEFRGEGFLWHRCPRPACRFFLMEGLCGGCYSPTGTAVAFAPVRLRDASSQAWQTAHADGLRQCHFDAAMDEEGCRQRDAVRHLDRAEVFWDSFSSDVECGSLGSDPW